MFQARAVSSKHVFKKPFPWPNQTSYLTRMLQLPKSVDSIEGAASSGILPLMNEVKWKVSKNGIKELHPSKYGWKGVCLSLCLSDLERKLNSSGCTATELDKIFRTSTDLYKSFLGGVLRSASLYGTALGQKQPLSSKSIYSLSLYPTEGDIPFWKP